MITSTWQRHDLLFGRCMPAVQAQTYENIEHIVVSDGPDPDLLRKMISSSGRGRRYAWLPEHGPEPRWGAAARNLALRMAKGEFIVYNDDDDAMRPDCIEVLLRAIRENPGTRWAYGRMQWHLNNGQAQVIGGPAPVLGQISGQMCMHTAGMAGWPEFPPSSIEDWQMIQSWITAGEKYVFADHVVIDVWPSWDRSEHKR